MKTLVQSGTELDELITAIQRADKIAIDVETSGESEEDGLNPWKGFLVGVGFAFPHDTYEFESFYLPMVVDNEDYKGLTWGNGDLNLLLNWSNKTATWYMHNAKFDLKWLELATDFRWEVGMLEDTMLKMFMARVDQPRGLKDLVARFFPGEPLPTPFAKVVGTGKKKRKLEQVHPAHLTDYCCADAINTLRILPHIEELMDSFGGAGVRKVYHELELPLLRLLTDMELAGILLNKDKLHSMVEQYVMLEEETEIQLQSYAAINWGSVQQVIPVLESLGLKLPNKRTKTGKQSLDIEVLQAMRGQHEVIDLILMERGLHKLNETYLLDFLSRADKDFRIHCDFVQASARTGRLSCRQPNLQNVPARPKKNSPIEMAYSEIRSLFTSKGKLIVADLNQIELRIAAHLSNDKELVRAFREGLDIHDITANAVAGGSRDIAKTVNYGYLYGQRERGLMNTTGCTMEEAKAFMNGFRRTYRGLDLWIERVEAYARRDGYVETIMGRRRHLPGIKSAQWSEQMAAVRQAVNTLVQGSAADYLKQAMLNIEQALRGSGVRMLLQVHDELVFECHPDMSQEDMEAAAQVIQYEMENAIELIVPVTTAPVIVDNWKQAK